VEGVTGAKSRIGSKWTQMAFGLISDLPFKNVRMEKECKRYFNMQYNPLIDNGL
jgi:hypothetical protein